MSLPLSPPLYVPSSGSFINMGLFYVLHFCVVLQVQYTLLATPSCTSVLKGVAFWILRAFSNNYRFDSLSLSTFLVIKKWLSPKCGTIMVYLEEEGACYKMQTHLCVEF